MRTTQQSNQFTDASQEIILFNEQLANNKYNSINRQKTLNSQTTHIKTFKTFYLPTNHAFTQQQHKTQTAYISNTQQLDQHDINTAHKLKNMKTVFRKRNTSVCQKKIDYRKNSKGFGISNTVKIKPLKEYQSKDSVALLSLPIDSQRQENISLVAEVSKHLISEQAQKLDKKSGPLTMANLESWLNNALIQYCVHQKFDKAIENCALKKYSIDRNALLSQGLKQQYLNRIYRSLFVYSIGFNLLITEIAGKNTSNLYKSIWKVFSILLEYCSGGKFQSLVAEIERDKIKKVEQLQGEIEKKQKQLQERDQLNQKKNYQIYQEIKDLREGNQQLKQQKVILMENLKHLQSAYDHQLQLRIKFQNVINQIHAVYNQLEFKHTNLYRDFVSEQIKQSQLLKRKLQLEKTTQLLKIENIKTQIQNKQIKAQFKSLSTTLNSLTQNIKYHSGKSIQLKNLNQLSNYSIQQCKKIIQTLKNRNNTIQKQLNNKQQSISHLNLELQQTLKQNNKLQKQILQSSRKFTQLIREQNQVKNKINQLTASSTYYKEKCNQLSKKVEQQKLKLKDESQKYRIIQVQLQSQIKKSQSIKKDNELYLVKIKQMKQLNERIVNDYQQIYNKHVQLLQTYQKCKGKLTMLTEQKLQFQYACTNMKIKISNLQSQSKKQNQKIKQGIQNQKKNNLKQIIQQNQIETQKKKSTAVMETTSIQLEKYQRLYQDSILSLKNQKFQRQNILIKYQQSLKVLDNQNQHIKDLNRHISELNNQIQVLKINIKSIQYQLNKQLKILRESHKIIQDQLKNAKQIIFNRKQYYHPMIVNDYQSRLMSKQQKIDFLIKSNKDLLEKIKQNQVNLSQKLQNIQKNHSDQISQLNQEVARILRLKQMAEEQINYEKQKYYASSQKIQDLELFLAAYKEKSDKVKIQQGNSQKQKKYLNIIQQKSKQISTLLIQLQQAHDQNTKTTKNMTNLKEIVEQKQTQLYNISIQLDNLEKKYIKQQKQLQSIYIQRGQSPNRLKSQQKQSQFKNRSRQQIQRTKTRNNIQQEKDSSQLQKDEDPDEYKELIKSKQCKSGKTQNNSQREGFIRKLKNTHQYYKKN